MLGVERVRPRRVFIVRISPVATAALLWIVRVVERAIRVSWQNKAGEVQRRLLGIPVISPVTRACHVLLVVLAIAQALRDLRQAEIIDRVFDRTRDGSVELGRDITIGLPVW